MGDSLRQYAVREASGSRALAAPEPRRIGGLEVAVPPALGPDALRVSITTSLQQYRELYTALRRPSRRRSSTNGVVPSSSDHRTIAFKFIQNSLLRDLADLYRMADSLEHKLLGQRRTKWMVHSSLALLTQVLYVQTVPAVAGFLSHAGVLPTLASSSLAAPRRQGGAALAAVDQQRMLYLRGFSGSLFYFVQWFGYPVAFYNILSSEKRITETSCLRDDLEDLLATVEGAEEVQEESILCFEDASWDQIPWELLQCNT